MCYFPKWDIILSKALSAKKPQNQKINLPQFSFSKAELFHQHYFLLLLLLPSRAHFRSISRLLSVWKGFRSPDISFEGVLRFTSFAFNKVQSCLPRVLKFSCYRYSTSKVNCLKLSSIVLCCRLSDSISWWFTLWYDLTNWPKLIFYDNSKGTWQVQKHDKNHLITADNSHWV